MRVHKLEVKNFRLLRNVSVLLEDRTTVIVGRNNSGKTSITELFRRCLGEKSPRLRLEDFSLPSIEGFWKALVLRKAAAAEQDIRAELPSVEVKLTISYDATGDNLAVLSDFIVDVDDSCTQALIVLNFSLAPGRLESLFEGFPKGGVEAGEEKRAFIRALRERISRCYEFSVFAVDPHDDSNSRSLDWEAVRKVIRCDFISAQRGLDDTTSKDQDVLGQILEGLFASAASEKSGSKERAAADELRAAVESIQVGLDQGFNTKLAELLPAFELFGYPGLSDPGLVTETTLDVDRLLSNHTKVMYASPGDIRLPETFNGLGVRNLIYILLQLLSFFRSFKARPIAAGTQLVFIEEPEAHLHPQMQEVFIRQLGAIVAEFEKRFNGGARWPVQFVVTTHSPHLANESRFESIRYFLGAVDHGSGARFTRVKDLRDGLGGAPKADRDFLHQYLTVTRCDLFFADKVILIEGASERLVLPRMMQVVDQGQPPQSSLTSQYISVLEVGGAYAHRFYGLLDFLELRTLLVTDLDAVKNAGGELCRVSEGTRTSNACLKDWFGKDVTPAELIGKRLEDKIKGARRIAFQVPELGATACGRSLEDAFILANCQVFGLDAEEKDVEAKAWELASKEKKVGFAIRFGVEDSNWVVPRYIEEGLRWLASGTDAVPLPPVLASGAPAVPSPGALRRADANG